VVQTLIDDFRRRPHSRVQPGGAVMIGRSSRHSANSDEQKRVAPPSRALGRSEAVNEAVRDHQLGAIEWHECGLVASLYRMCDALAGSRFADEALASVLICPSRAGCRRSRYRTKRNGMAIRHVIEVNVPWLQQLDDFQRLVALAYEMLHAWQATRGTPPGDGRIHNRQFIDKAAAVGLGVGGRRHEIKGVSEPFFDACRAAGIAVPSKLAERLPLPAPAKAGGNRWRRWSCGCQSIYHGGRNALGARCNRCGNEFSPTGIKKESEDPYPNSLCEREIRCMES